MAFFGGGELNPEIMGPVHPSLKTFIDCFCSAPLPKMYPRGGGPHNQDPILMRDFRDIIRFKGQCEELADAEQKAKEQLDKQGLQSNSAPAARGGMGLEGLLDQAIEDGDFNI